MGLSISKAYIEMLGGRIWVESEEGIGSTFYFTLPFNRAQKAKTVDAIVSSQSVVNLVKKLKVLVVDDDEISQILLSKYLTQLGNEVLQVYSGLKAVEVCQNNSNIDLVLMDIKMPGMDGYEATRQIRKFNNDVVIVAQTAYGLTGDREKSLSVGCNDYISKPINLTTLTRIIQKHF